MVHMAVSGILGASIVPAGLLPDEDDVRVQKIERVEAPEDWPFTVDGGYLACVEGLGQRVVIFMADDTAENFRNGDVRHVIVSVDPFDLAFGNVMDRELIDPAIPIEDLIRRMAPLVETGKRLCEQEPGVLIGPGEL